MYLWIKAFHIIFMVAWFAGLFYIFRLFVYHVQNQDDAKICSIYETMERRLLTVIIQPAFFLTLVLGFILAFVNQSVVLHGWFYVKLLGVAGLIVYQLFSKQVYRRFASKDFFLSEKQCRMINEVPTLFLILIVVMVIVRPF